MMWPFAVLCGLFIFNILLVFTSVRFVKQMDNIVVWISEKQIELAAVEKSKDLINYIDNHIQLITSWIIQTKNIIIPGLGATQLITAFTIGEILEQNLPSLLLSNTLALVHAGVIMCSIVMAQRMFISLKITHKVNDEVIKLTVLKEAEKIEADENYTGE